VLCYGDLFQWGRGADGHEKRTSSSADNNPTVFPYTASQIFELAYKGDYDWLTIDTINQKSAFVAERIASWAKSTNNPVCPEGWYVPSKIELEALKNAENITDGASAYTSSLKLPLAGRRSNDGNIGFVGRVGYIWTRDSAGAGTGANGANTSYSFTYDGGALFSKPYKAEGQSVRCIKK